MCNALLPIKLNFNVRVAAPGVQHSLDALAGALQQGQRAGWVGRRLQVTATAADTSGWLAGACSTVQRVTRSAWDAGFAFVPRTAGMQPSLPDGAQKHPNIVIHTNAAALALVTRTTGMENLGTKWSSKAFQLSCANYKTAACLGDQDHWDGDLGYQCRHLWPVLRHSHGQQALLRNRSKTSMRRSGRR